MNETLNVEGTPAVAVQRLVRPLPTLEEATAHWQQAMSVLQKYPEARTFNEYRKKWSKQNSRREKLESQAAAAREKERVMWEELQTMKAALTDDARDALC